MTTTWTVTLSSQLENNGRLLFKYVTNVVAYTYSSTETVYLKVTNVVKPTHQNLAQILFIRCT